MHQVQTLQMALLRLVRLCWEFYWSTTCTSTCMHRHTHLTMHLAENLRNRANPAFLVTEMVDERVIQVLGRQTHGLQLSKYWPQWLQVTNNKGLTNHHNDNHIQPPAHRSLMAMCRNRFIPTLYTWLVPGWTGIWDRKRRSTKEPWNSPRPASNRLKSTISASHTHTNKSRWHYQVMMTWTPHTTSGLTVLPYTTPTIPYQLVFMQGTLGHTFTRKCTRIFISLHSCEICSNLKPDVYMCVFDVSGYLQENP